MSASIFVKHNIFSGKFFLGLLLYLCILITLFLGAMHQPLMDIPFYILALLGIIFFRQAVLPTRIKVWIALGFLFLTYLVLSLIFFKEYSAFFEWRFETYRFILFLPLVAFALSQLDFSENWFWYLLVSATLFAMSSVLVEYLYNGMPPRGGWDQPINRGNLGMLLGVSSFVAFFALTSIRWKFLATVAFVFGVAVSVISGSRGGWLTLPLAFLTLVIVFFRIDRKKLKTVAVLGMLLICLLAIFYEYLPISQRIHQTIASLEAYLNGNVDTSLGYRLEMWKASIYGLQQSPLWGWGWDHYSMVMKEAKENGIIITNKVFGHPHNHFFLFGVEIGSVGLLLFLLFLMYPMYVSIRYIRDSQKINANVYYGILVIVVIESLLEFSLSDDSLSWKYFLLIYFIVVLVSFFRMFMTKNVKEKSFDQR